MERAKRNAIANEVVDQLKEKDLLESEAISVLRKSISIIDALNAKHKLR